MHKYLKSIGFSNLLRRNDINQIIRDVVERYDERIVVKDYPDGIFLEYVRYYAGNGGIAVCGQLEESTNQFHVEYYFPFFKSGNVIGKEKLTVERQADQEAFQAACDDCRLGMTLIFYVQNPAKYMKERLKLGAETRDLEKTLVLSGLAEEGHILLPILKDDSDVRMEKELSQKRTEQMEAAMDGDEEAMETITMEDMDTYSLISQRIVNEDVFSIVDSSFMPNGIICDHYTVLGEIQSVAEISNAVTEEEMFLLGILCNDIPLDICINKKNLLGEPRVGRRFKGNIWLQGEICFD